MQMANVTINHTEIYNCSQRNTFKAAVRFENVISMPQLITNSVVHGGLGWGLHVKASSNVEITNSAFIGALAIGVNIEAVSGFKMYDCVVADVNSRLNEAINFADK